MQVLRTQASRELNPGAARNLQAYAQEIEGRLLRERNGLGFFPRTIQQFQSIISAP